MCMSARVRSSLSARRTPHPMLEIAVRGGVTIKTISVMYPDKNMQRSDVRIAIAIHLFFFYLRLMYEDEA
jgi:hypothetical protein